MGPLQRPFLIMKCQSQTTVNVVDVDVYDRKVGVDGDETIMPAMLMIDFSFVQQADKARRRGSHNESHREEEWRAEGGWSRGRRQKGWGDGVVDPRQCFEN